MIENFIFTLEFALVSDYAKTLEQPPSVLPQNCTDAEM